MNKFEIQTRLKLISVSCVCLADGVLKGLDCDEAIKKVQVLLEKLEKIKEDLDT